MPVAGKLTLNTWLARLDCRLYRAREIGLVYKLTSLQTKAIQFDRSKLSHERSQSCAMCLQSRKSHGRCANLRQGHYLDTNWLLHAPN